MKFRRPIYRILFFAAWLAVLGGITTLVIAANGKTALRRCQGVEVTVNGDRIFVEQADVLKAVNRTANGPVVNRRFADINLGALERALETNHWIRDAELYFDTRDVLHVSVWERQPIARVFTTAGTSFYIDSTGYSLPLLDGYSVKLPVVTGFTAAKKRTAKDSAVLQGLKQIVREIGNDPFWTAQVGQIDITPERKFDLIPLIGSHVIRLGYAENVSQKLANLLVFYKQVLPKAGLAKYSVLDLQFDGQVVAVRRGPASPVDSLQLQKNIEELMLRKAAEEEPDDPVAAVPAKAAESTLKKDSVQAETLINPKPVAQTATRSNPIPAKTAVQKSNSEKPVPRKPSLQKPATQPTKKGAQKPRAVMPAKPVRNEY